jgi:hypothetical protein
MSEPIYDYANYVIEQIHKYKSKSVINSLERESRTRLSLSFEKAGKKFRFRILMFAVGGTGRGRDDERRIEITSTYDRGLKRDSSVIDIVLGVERHEGVLVGIDARRLNFGGPTSNASTFVYSAGFDSLKTHTHDVMVNPSSLIVDEHQIYMNPAFLIDYLTNAQSLHHLGVAASSEDAAELPERKTISPDDPTPPSTTAKLTFAQQIRLAMLKMEVGQAGERHAAVRERRRLIDVGHPSLAAKIRWVSQTHPYVGYDISSFAQDGKPEFVEVKSSTNKLKRFHFSNNELRVAEKLQISYRIVCVSNVFEKPSFYEIRNPAAQLEAGTLSKVADGYIISI